MSDFISRLETEKQELDEKIEKLEAFFPTETFKNLHEIDKLLLEMQRRTMDEYSRVLNARLMRLRG